MRRLLAGLAASCLALVGTAALASGEGEGGPGKQIYDKYCAQCHGVTGDGNGHATGRVKPAPRDFTSGKYKFRTTPSGMLPTDDDLRRVIKIGLPYTSMPGWPNLTDGEIDDVIEYIKTFSEDFQNPDKKGDPIDLPEPPPSTEESVARGRTVYEEQGCAACHGNVGRGDGLSGPTLRDDWGDHLQAVDMTMRWTFRGGPTRKDIFRTFSTGVNGTPMPSYFDSLAVEDRWDLVNYIYSLGESDEPNYSNLMLVPIFDEEIDLERGAELFEGAPVARFPLVGQIVEPGRNFYASTTSLQAQAIYNYKEIAFLIRWHDMRAETSGSNAPDIEVPLWDEDQPESADAGDEDEEGGFWGDEEIEEEEGDDFWGEEEEGAGADASTEFSDAVALQFPSTMPTGIRKPYFLFGDTENPVDLWFVDLANGRPRQYTGRGSTELTPADTGEIEVATSYEEGQWSVIFKRPLRSASGVPFQQDSYVPIAFSVWDGFNRERGNKRALSSWFYLYVEPAEEISAVGPMVRAALITLVIELLLVLYIRRRFAKSGPESASAGEAIPEGGMAGPST